MNHSLNPLGVLGSLGVLGDEKYLYSRLIHQILKTRGLAVTLINVERNLHSSVKGV